MPSIALLAIGSEILDGRIQDTNSNFLCRELNAEGFHVNEILSCTDDIGDIVKALTYLSTSHQVILITGGLGPTTDDLTREAVAKFCSVGLVRNEEAIEDLKVIYQKRGRKYDTSNETQAYLPVSSVLIKNPLGSAPGFYIWGPKISSHQALIVSVPGVPLEMKEMYARTIKPLLKETFHNITPLHVLGFKCFALPEATIGAKIKELNLPETITVSYRASFPEVHVALKSYSQISNELADKVKSAVGSEYIFTDNLNQKYEEVVQDLLLKNKLTISTAESCTGGLLASLLTNTAGSSACFLGSIVSYSNDIKVKTLAVNQETIQKHGAVSAETACEMAAQCRLKLGTDLAVSITGIAGPDGGSENKPVGLFYAALADKKEVHCIRGFIPIDRKRIRTYAAYMGLDLIRRYLLNITQIKDAALPAQ